MGPSSGAEGRRLQASKSSEMRRRIVVESSGCRLPR